MPDGGRHRVEQARRLKFIDEELFWRGEITRARIMKAFDVHEDTAKADLRIYRRDFAPELSPGRHDNRYRMGEGFQPRIEPYPVAEDYLRRLAGDHGEALPIDGSGPEIDTTPLLVRRPIDPLILQSLVRALGAGQELEILYRSASSRQAKSVWILPEGFLHDGFRWSCRCYRYDFEGWGEAVLDRIEDVLGGRRPADANKVGQDSAWTNRVRLRLGPNPGLDPSQAAGIAAQYDMQNGVAEIDIRPCQVAYFLKRYQLEEPVSLKAPHQAPIVLLNRDEAIAAIPPGMRVPLDGLAAGAGRLILEARSICPALTEQQILEVALEQWIRAQSLDRQP
jgi:hypothetical protein